MNIPTNLNDALNLRFGNGADTGALPVWMIQGSGLGGGVGTLTQNIGAPGAAGIQLRELALLAGIALAVWIVIRFIR